MFILIIGSCLMWDIILDGGWWILKDGNRKYSSPLDYVKDFY